MIAALGVAVAALAVGRGASGLTGTGLSFDIGAPGGCAELGVGEELQVALMITDVEELQAWEATVSHDFGVIRIIEQDALVLLGQGFEASEPLPDTNGQHLLAVGSTQAVSVTGPSVLATIKFEAVAAGVSIIDIPQTDFDSDGDTDLGAILQIGGTFIGDVNGDNFFDGPVQSARIAVNSSCVSPTEQPTDPPTPRPVTPSPSATASPTTTPTQSLSPTAVVTPTPVGQTPTPQPTSAPWARLWGDVDCSNAVDPVDSLKLLRWDAGLSVSYQDSQCPQIGAAIPASLPATAWGDIDCSGQVDPVDALKTLRYDAGLSVSQSAGCPEIAAPF